ncbi:MAG: PKD domain-containing protein, partial [Gammaproteobacteria bacterium]|nr:PKD domain-containing protein [Gammaproteobacteria bacterium]
MKNSRSFGFGIKNFLVFAFVLSLFQFNNAMAEEVGIFGESGILPANTCQSSGCHVVAVAPAPLIQVPDVFLESATATPGGTPVAVTAGSTHTFTLRMANGPMAIDPAVPANAGFSVAANNGVLSLNNAASANPTHDSTGINLPSLEITFGDGNGGKEAGIGGPVDVPNVSASNFTSWTFDWQAPVRTTGEDVIIYAGVVASDGDRTEAGDGVTMLTVTIPVSASVNTPPSAMITAPATSTAGALVTFDGTGSTFDAGGSIASYSWDFGDGTTGTGATTTHTYADANTYTVSLTVIDDLGAPNTVTSTITITAADNVAPVAEITAPTAPAAGTVGTAITFDGTGSTDSDGIIETYEWTFGDM